MTVGSNPNRPTRSARRGLSRRQFLAASATSAAVAAASRLVPANEAYAAASGDSYQLTNPYFSLQGSGGAFSFLAFDPTGKGSYGPNLLAGSGLLFQFQGDGIPSVVLHK